MLWWDNEKFTHWWHSGGEYKFSTNSVQIHSLSNLFNYSLTCMNTNLIRIHLLSNLLNYSLSCMNLLIVYKSTQFLIDLYKFTHCWPINRSLVCSSWRRLAIMAWNVRPRLGMVDGFGSILFFLRRGLGWFEKEKECF